MTLQTKIHPAGSINREAAHALIEAARKAAKEIGIETTIAIVDPGGHLKAYERSDQAAFLTADVAVDKAWTAASFGLPTHTWAQIIGNSEVAQLAHRPRLVAVGGGYPIVVDGQVVGGLGISGGSALQDQQACEEALRRVGFEIR
jgi:uncharacterized protein GlcG (DUF336 family)